MALDTYKELMAEVAKEFLKDYSGREVIVGDAYNRDILFGGILDFDAKNPEFYYLTKDIISRRFHVHDLEKLIIPLDS